MRARTLKKHEALRFMESTTKLMRGDVPPAIERDKAFCALFSEWARTGRKDKGLELRMRARWNEVLNVN